ncbi:MAG: hypothetical protein U5K00_07155 [Melioribacteraceae bacterium]|nr:hypothetical protein [Melioribacteraceae bacterium]
MLKIFKKIFFVISLVLLYLTVKEFLQLYSYLSNISPILAIIVIALLTVVIIYFGILPIAKIILLPTSLGPTKDESKVETLLENRIKKLRGNSYLREINFDFSSVKNDNQSYERMIDAIKPESHRIRKKYVNSVFYGTAVSQNGFLDAIMIFSAAINLNKEIFELYNGRVNNRDLFSIWKRIYYSIVIGGSQGIEYASEEVFSKLTTDSMRSIPFLDKIFSSLADGFVNAVLLTRISLITENYCTKLYIKNERELFPKPAFVIAAAKDLTKDMLAKIKDNMISLAKEKSETIFKKAVNPVTLVLDKSYQSIRGSKTLEFGTNVFRKGYEKIPFLKKKS